MSFNTAITDFIHQVRFADAPPDIQAATRRALLDLLGVSIAGSSTALSRIIREHAVTCFGSPDAGARLMFDGRRCSVPGAVLAGGMQIDSVDAHDGHKLAKGHVGCGVLPAAMAFSELDPEVSEQELLGRLLMGYEIGSRAAIALHQTASDYHTSGAWVALASAAIGSRALSLDAAATREALGIAEYHGPRSQMMRTIDYPTMVKDGSGWGAMAGASAAMLAASGFTGAPAVTMDSADVSELWADFGDRWYVTEQYIKAYPVCRWAQPAIAAVLKIKAEHDFSLNDIETIEVGTFHEASRLATSQPATTEQAQYSLPFPVAVALVYGEVRVSHIDGDGLSDPVVRALSETIRMVEVADYNHAFPARRLSHVTLTLKDARKLASGPIEAAGDPENPFDDEVLNDKFMALSSPVMGEFGAMALRDEVTKLGQRPTLSLFNALAYKSVS